MARVSKQSAVVNLIDPALYVGKEQTYVKHLFLRAYLERVALNIMSSHSDFVYVDGFSGPWRSSSDKFNDTSFNIAIDQLRRARAVYANRGHARRVRCFFIESDIQSFKLLNEATRSIQDIEILCLNSEFEDAIEKIVDFVGNSFSFLFIDPTGWTGFGLNKIEPLLKLRGEVLINFMFNHINWFINSHDPKIVESMNALMGDQNWREEIELSIKQGIDREHAILRAYQRRLKARGRYPFVTSTSVLYPQKDRTIFHLVYATRHWKGLFEFRESERRTYEAQKTTRSAAHELAKRKKSNQEELFEVSVDFGRTEHLDQIRDRAKPRLIGIVDGFVRDRHSFKYGELEDAVLIEEFLWRKDLVDELLRREKSGQISIERQLPTSRKVDRNCQIAPMK